MLILNPGLPEIFKTLSKGCSMAQIKVLDSFPIELQAQPEKKFTGRDGNPVLIPAQKERRATVILAEHEQACYHFVLPESYDSSRVKKGSVLHVDCPMLEQVSRLTIRNVTRTIDPVGK